MHGIEVSAPKNLLKVPRDSRGERSSYRQIFTPPSSPTSTTPQAVPHLHVTLASSPSGSDLTQTSFERPASLSSGTRLLRPRRGAGRCRRRRKIRLPRHGTLYGGRKFRSLDELGSSVSSSSGARSRAWSESFGHRDEIAWRAEGNVVLPYAVFSPSSSVSSFTDSVSSINPYEGIWPDLPLPPREHWGRRAKMPAQIPNEFSLYTATWNLGGHGVPPDDELAQFLLPGDEGVAMSDFYIVSFQELVELNVKTMFGDPDLHKRAVRADLDARVQEFLSRSRERRQYRETGIKGSKNYVKLDCVSMVGLHMTIFAKSELAATVVEFTRRDRYKAGLGGITGNKGAVALHIRMRIGNKEIDGMVINVHLESGRGAVQAASRNNQINELSRFLFSGEQGDDRTVAKAVGKMKASLSSWWNGGQPDRGYSVRHSSTSLSSSSLGSTRSPQRRPIPSSSTPLMASADFVLIMGDFNCHLEGGMTHEQIQKCVQSDCHTALLKVGDPFTTAEIASPLHRFFEAKVHFKPTYKYRLDSSTGTEYNWSRTPAWCDRVFAKGDFLQVVEYSRRECICSDHRPVISRWILSETPFPLNERGGRQPDRSCRLSPESLPISFAPAVIDTGPVYPDSNQPDMYTETQSPIYAHRDPSSKPIITVTNGDTFPGVESPIVSPYSARPSNGHSRGSSESLPQSSSGLPQGDSFARPLAVGHGPHIGGRDANDNENDGDNFVIRTSLVEPGGPLHSPEDTINMDAPAEQDISKLVSKELIIVDQAAWDDEKTGDSVSLPQEKSAVTPEIATGISAASFGEPTKSTPTKTTPTNDSNLMKSSEQESDDQFLAVTSEAVVNLQLGEPPQSAGVEGVQFFNTAPSGAGSDEIDIEKKAKKSNSPEPLLGGASDDWPLACESTGEDGKAA